MKLALRVWLDEDEIRAVHAAARRDGRNIGAWIRELVLREVRQSLMTWRRAA